MRTIEPAAPPVRRWSALLALLLIPLSAALIAYPREMQAADQAPLPQDILTAPWLFAALYSGWAAVLAVCAVGQGRAAPRWFGLTLAVDFSLVSRGIWDAYFPARGPDAIANMSTVAVLPELGSLSHSTEVFYRDFPGLHFLTSSLAQLSGLGLFDAVTLILFAIAAVAAALHYLVARAILKDSRTATLAALLALQGSLFFANFAFFPSFLGLVFIAAFLYLLVSDGIDPLRRVFLAILLLGAATVSHFISAVMLLAFLAGVSALGWLQRREQRRVVPAWGSLLLYAVAPLAWLSYWGTDSFANLAQMATTVVDYLEPDQFLGYGQLVAKANLAGETLPLWMRADRLFWLAVIYAAGSLAVVGWLIARRPARDVELKAVAAFLGLAGFTAIVVLPLGGEQLQRFFMYAPLVTVPFLLRYVQLASAGWQRSLLAVSAAAFVLLAAPTFLTHSTNVTYWVFTPEEFATAEFVAARSAPLEVDGLTIFAGASRAPFWLHFPNADYAGYPPSSDIEDVRGFWTAVSDTLSDFESPDGGAPARLFVASTADQRYYGRLLGLRPDAPEWRAAGVRLARADRIYDAGEEAVYIRLPARDQGRTAEPALRLGDGVSDASARQ